MNWQHVGFFGLQKCWRQTRVTAFVSSFCCRKQEISPFQQNQSMPCSTPCGSHPVCLSLHSTTTSAQRDFVACPFCASCRQASPSSQTGHLMQHGTEPKLRSPTSQQGLDLAISALAPLTQLQVPGWLTSAQCSRWEEQAEQSQHLPKAGVCVLVCLPFIIRLHSHHSH